MNRSDHLQEAGFQVLATALLCIATASVLVLFGEWRLAIMPGLGFFSLVLATHHLAQAEAVGRD